LTLPEARDAVRDFRLANAPIVSLWHGCEASAKAAINRPGERVFFRRLAFRMADPKGRLAGALLMELPSGRRLVYRNARIEAGRIVYWGVNQYTRRWCEMDTYGGKLVENACQSVARDLLAETMVALEREFPGALLTTVHDEIVALTKNADAAELFTGMKLAMSTPPVWAQGMPLSSAGEVLGRYQKL
jgi:DNA polymerase